MNKTNFNMIIKHVKSLCPQIRKPKHTSAYYLKNILNMLSESVSTKGQMVVFKK